MLSYRWGKLPIGRGHLSDSRKDIRGVPASRWHLSHFTVLSIEFPLLSKVTVMPWSHLLNSLLPFRFTTSQTYKIQCVSVMAVWVHAMIPHEVPITSSRTRDFKVVSWLEIHMNMSWWTWCSWQAGLLSWPFSRANLDCFAPAYLKALPLCPCWIMLPNHINA